ncbi:Protein of unknown function, partial [Cotesia congregata]
KSIDVRGYNYYVNDTCSVTSTITDFFQPNKKYPIAAPNTTAMQSHTLYVINISMRKYDKIICMMCKNVWKAYRACHACYGETSSLDHWQQLEPYGPFLNDLRDSWNRGPCYDQPIRDSYDHNIKDMALKFINKENRYHNLSNKNHNCQI